MGNDGFTDIDRAKELVRTGMNTVLSLRDGAFWKLAGQDLLALGQQLQTLSRTVYTVNVHLAGEIDTQTLAKQRSCPSTAALLRQILMISPTEAHHRINIARVVLPQEILTGGGLFPRTDEGELWRRAAGARSRADRIARFIGPAMTPIGPATVGIAQLSLLRWMLPA